MPLESLRTLGCMGEPYLAELKLIQLLCPARLTGNLEKSFDGPCHQPWKGGMDPMGHGRIPPTRI